MFWSNYNAKFNYLCQPTENDNHIQKKSHSFCLKLCSLELPINILENDNEKITLRASLLDFNCKRFIGKQWNSSKIKNSEKFESLIKMKLNETICFHTSKIDESLLVLFEVIRCRSDATETSIGWSVFKVFNTDNKFVDISSNEQSPLVSVSIYKGTPRALLIMEGISESYKGLQNYDQSFVHFTFNINKSFDSCQHLIPENFLLHEHDDIPGFKRMAHNITDFTKAKLIQFNDYSIDNLKIVFEPSLFAFENNFKKMLNTDWSTETNTSINNSESIVITERRLKIGVHNGYTFVENPETVCLSVQDSKVKSTRSSITSRSDNVSENTLKVKNPVGVLLPDDRRFAVIFFLEYVVSQSPSDESAKKSGIISPSSQHIYHIGWAFYQPFIEEVDVNLLQNGIRFELKLSGGSEEAPENVLFYRSETIVNSSSTKDGDNKEYNGNEMTLSAMFRTKIVKESEPKIQLRKNSLSYLENKSESDIHMPKAESPVNRVVAKKQHSSRKSDIKEARIRQHQQMITNQPIPDGDPLQMSSVHLGTTTTLTTDTLINYKDIEPYVIPQDSDPSARGRSEYMQPLQMRPYSGVALSRDAFRQILLAGFSDFLDGDGNTPLLVEQTDVMDKINWALEENDKRDCDEIIFQFMALSRYDMTSNMAQTNFVFFTLQFYQFPPDSTERLKICNTIENVSIYLSSNPMILQSQNKDGSSKNHEPGAVLRYMLKSGCRNVRERYSYLEYLSQQMLHIDVWDGESLLLLGSCTVPLKSLCRQGNTSVQVLYELDIVNQSEIEEGNISAIKGRLHLRMINLGSISSVKARRVPFSIFKENNFLIDSTETERYQLNGHSEDVLRPQTSVAKHIELAELIKSRSTNRDATSINSTKSPLLNDDILRGMSQEKFKKLSRIKSLMSTLEMTGETRHDVHVDKLTDLDIIQSYRQRQKNANIRQMLSSVIEKEVSLYTRFGCTDIFEIKIKNHFNHECIIAIEIVDASNGLTLVRNAQELRALKNLYQIVTPSEDDLITTNKQRNCPEIFMRPKESVLVPFKYTNLSFCRKEVLREPSVEGISAKQLDSFDQTVIESHIIFRTNDDKLLTKILIKVHPQTIAIDQTFRFFHPEQSYLKRIIRLPPLHLIAGPYDTIKALLRCSDPAVQVHCQPVPLGTPHDVFVRVNCGPAPEIRQFLLAVYADRFMLRPIQVWQFTIHSQKRNDVVAYQGQTSQYSLLVKTSLDASRLSAFSSNPNELSVNKNVLANGACDLNITPRKIGSRMFTVNIVDVDMAKLVTAWSICAICKEPNVKKVFELEIPAKGGDECKKKVSYTNPYGVDKSFFVITNRQDLVMFKNTILRLGPNKMDYIGIIFLPVTALRQEKIFVFINNEDGNNEEAFSILVNYV